MRLRRIDRSIAHAAAVIAAMGVGQADAVAQTSTGTEPQAEQPATQPQTQPVAPSNLPDAQLVIDQAIEAVGGKSAIEAIKSITIKATLSTERGDGQLELYAAEPNLAFIRRKDAHGELSLGSDGEIGWHRPPNGNYQLLDEMQTDHIRRQANVYRILLKLRDDYHDFQTIDRLEFDGSEVLKVKMIDHRGKLQFALFDVESKLIRALQIVEDEPEGERIVTVRFDEWKQHGDILGFTKATIQDKRTSVLTIQEVELNTTDRKLFETPAEVKALAATRAKSETMPATAPATQPQTTSEDSEEEDEEAVDEEDAEEEEVDPEDEDDDEPEDEG